MGILSRIFGSSEKRVSLENPSFDINNPPDWAFDMMGARKAASGVNVSPETALTMDTVWRGVNLIGGDVGKLPLEIRKRLQPAGSERDPGHQAYYLLKHKPNEWMTALHFRRLLTAHAIMFGNGYAYIYRDRYFTPIELAPLSPVTTWPVRANGVIMYVTRVNNEPDMRKIAAHDMIHIKGFGPDGLQGYNWCSKARESLGLGMAAQQYSSVFFRNGGKPHVVIKFPNAMGKKERDELRDGWERMQSGLENAHRTAVIDRGGELQEMQMNARDSQLIQTMEFSRVQIANFLGLPPHKLGDDSRTAYNSLEQENQAYLDDGLDPWLHTWESEGWDKLLTEEEKTRDSHVVRFDRKRLVRADIGARTTYYVQGLSNGWLCPDDVREEEGLNPLPDNLGQEFTRPLNLGVIGEEPEPVQTPVPPEPDQAGDKMRAACRPLLADALGRMIRRLAVHARKAAKEPRTFTAWLDTLDVEHGPTIRAALAPPAEVLGAIGLKASAELLAGQLLARTRELLLQAAGGARAAELEGAVERVMGEFEAWSVQQVDTLLERKAA